MSNYNIRAIHPVTKMITTFLSVSESQLYTTVAGQKVFLYNDHHKLPVISLEKVSVAYQQAEAAYFNQFGTVGE